MIQKLRSNKNLSRIDSDYNRNKPEVKLIVNKNKVKDLGYQQNQLVKHLGLLMVVKKLQLLIN